MSNSYYYPKKKPAYTKMSLKKLKTLESEILDDYPDFESLKLYSSLYPELLEEYENHLKTIQSLEKHSDDIELQAKKRSIAKYNNKSFFERFMGGTIRTEYTTQEIQTLKEISVQQENLRNKDFSFKRACYFAYLNYEKLMKIQRAIKRKEKKQIDTARVASIDRKSRKVANGVKSQIADENKCCPYCLVILDNSAHCDHIFPISKGGLSVPSNMVFVCKNCNLQKSNLTLNQFIDKYSLDREKVFNCLSSLNKDY